MSTDVDVAPRPAAVLVVVCIVCFILFVPAQLVFGAPDHPEPPVLQPNGTLVSCPGCHDTQEKRMGGSDACPFT